MSNNLADFKESMLSFHQVEWNLAKFLTFH